MLAHHRRIALAIFLVGTLLLTSCGPTPAPTAAPTAAPAAPTAAKVAAAPPAAPTVASTDAPTVAPTQAPTEPPTAAPTKAPTKAPTMAPETTAAPTPSGDEQTTEAASGLSDEALDAMASRMGEEVAEGYGALLMIDACAVVLEEMAETMASGEIDPLAAMGSLLMFPFLIEMVDEALVEGAPDAVLDDAWEEALVVLPMLREVSEGWFSEEIAIGDVPERLEPVHRRIDTMIALADDALVDAFDIDPDDLMSLRAAMVVEVRKGLMEAMEGMDDIVVEDDVVLEGDDSIEFVDVTWSLDSVGDLVFVGELRNGGEETVGVVEVQVTLNKSDGQPLASETGIALVSALEPGDVAPFMVDFLKNPGEFEDYEIVARAAPLGGYMGNVYTSFRLTRETVQEADEGYYELLLEAENVGAEAAAMVEAVVTAYDADGKVVGVGSTMATQNRVLPGDLATFDVSFAVVGEVDSYSILYDAYAEEIDELPELEIVNLVWLVDDWDDSYCVGEIANHSSKPANGVSIAVTVEDADGGLVAVDEGYSGLDIIPAGGTSPFRVTFWDEIPDDGTYQATVTGDIAQDYALESVYTGLEIVEHTLDYSDDGDLVLTGRVENVGDLTAEYVKVVITGYDVDEDVVVAETGYLEIDTLKPGASAPFMINTYAPIPVEDYRLQIEASAES